MYKIYVNETPIILTQMNEINIEQINLKQNLLVRYSGVSRSLLSPIDMCEKTNRYESVTIYAPDKEQLWKDFQSLYKQVAAAGGLVVNSKGELLTMFRRGFWDLPKGKIDEGETPEAAAIREVQEETGLEKLTLEHFVGITYHTYKNKKGNRILKPTYWYKMFTEDTSVTPQTEEDIEKLEWLLPELFLEKTPLYNSIKSIVRLMTESF